ncbi:hypothetical protein NLX67_03030 [Domibacillus sp. A3M-37]|uniref:hypothetical protein n=1 Tax=Domibacillus sp. A3M-37 TaxID=2962037 RepID=UPI0020B885BA|nr:hypothetical protein [Domibacillus sp. A3M-37]MCP3761364.1 hypothetical protein [Domibacillus sp. A3M-37]
MNRRNFLVKFLLWILSFFLGYKVGEAGSTIIIDKDGNMVSEKIDMLKKELADNTNTVGILKRKTDTWIDVEDFGATGDASGVLNQTQAIQNAINEAVNQKVPLRLHPRTVYPIHSLEIPPELVIEGKNATLKPLLDGATMLNADFVTPNTFEIYDIFLDMTDKPNVTGMNCNRVRDQVIQRFKSVGGKYGIKYQNSYNNHLDQLKIYKFGTSGIYIQGDGGAEFEISNAYGTGVKKALALLEIERTTEEDVGAFYLYNVLGFYSKHSIYAHSNNPNGSTIVVNLTGGGGDNTTEEPLAFVNVNNVRVNNAWVAAKAANGFNSVKLNNVTQAYFNNSYLPHGFRFKTKVKDFGAENLPIPYKEAFNIDGNPVLENIKFDNIDAPVGLTNDANKLIAGVTLSTPTTGRSFYLSPSVYAGAMHFINASNPDFKKSVSMSENDWVMLDSAFSPIFEVWDNGTVKAKSQFRVGDNKVIGERIDGWATPLGTSSRSGFNTSTATTQEVAQAFRALIEDLKAHGLIGK